MNRFPRSFEYKGYKIRRTSFNWHVTGDGIDELVESLQDGKDVVDRHLIEQKHEVSKKMIDNDLEELLS